MNEAITIHAEGNLSLLEAEGEGEGLSKTPGVVQPFTFVLSSSQEERREKATILLLCK